MAISNDVATALLGAAGGLVSGGLLGLGSWFFSRRRRARAIKVALYYEIFRHHIFPVSPAENGDPNFMIIGFARAAYDAHLGEIPDLLPEKLVGAISMYYADVTTAAAQQARIDDGTAEIREAARKLTRLESSQTLTNPVHSDEIELARQEGVQVAHRMTDMMRQNRHLLATAMWQRGRLLPALAEEFDHDPAKEPVNVLPKYREWFDRECRARGLTPIESGEEE